MHKTGFVQWALPLKHEPLNILKLEVSHLQNFGASLKYKHLLQNNKEKSLGVGISQSLEVMHMCVWVKSIKVLNHLQSFKRFVNIILWKSDEEKSYLGVRISALLTRATMTRLFPTTEH